MIGINQERDNSAGLPYGIREFNPPLPGLGLLIEETPRGLPEALEHAIQMREHILMLTSDQEEVAAIEIAEAHEGSTIEVLNFARLYRSQRAQWAAHLLGDAIRGISLRDLQEMVGNEVQFPLVVVNQVNPFKHNLWLALQSAGRVLRPHGQLFAQKVVLEADRGPRELRAYLAQYGAVTDFSHVTTPGWLERQGYHDYGIRVSAGEDPVFFPQAHFESVSGPTNSPLLLNLPHIDNR